MVIFCVISLKEHRTGIGIVGSGRLLMANHRSFSPTPSSSSDRTSRVSVSAGYKRLLILRADQSSGGCMVILQRRLRSFFFSIQSDREKKALFFFLLSLLSHTSIAFYIYNTLPIYLSFFLAQCLDI